MTTTKAFAKGHPLVLFFALAYHSRSITPSRTFDVFASPSIDFVPPIERSSAEIALSSSRSLHAPQVDDEQGKGPGRH